MKEYFDYTIEKDSDPRYLVGQRVFAMVQKVKVKLGKKSLVNDPNKKKNTPFIVEGVPLKKNSIVFTYLEYWKELAVRHAIDSMHLEKNVFESTIGVLDLSTKKKDGLKSRMGMERLGIRPDVAEPPNSSGSECDNHCC